MRLFVAIELSSKVRSALSRVQSTLRVECRDVRWVPAENIHLTVKFIGDVSDRDVDAVARAVTGVAGEVEPFELEISGSGCFPASGPVRIVWAGVHEGSGALLRCAERLEDALWELGVAREPRRYSPHLTVGRVRRDVSEGSLRAAVDTCHVRTILQSVSALTLMSSDRSSKGPIYTPVSKTKFGRTG